MSHKHNWNKNRTCTICHRHIDTLHPSEHIESHHDDSSSALAAAEIVTSFTPDISTSYVPDISSGTDFSGGGGDSGGGGASGGW